MSKGYLKDLGDGKFKSIEPNEEILETGKDENEETPEQLELERKRAEQEQNFEVRGILHCLFAKNLILNTESSKIHSNIVLRCHKHGIFLIKQMVAIEFVFE